MKIHSAKWNNREFIDKKKITTKGIIRENVQENPFSITNYHYFHVKKKKKKPFKK